MMSLEFLIFRPHYDPELDSASNRNEYQEYLSGVKPVLRPRCIGPGRARNQVLFNQSKNTEPPFFYIANCNIFVGKFLWNISAGRPLQLGYLLPMKTSLYSFFCRYIYHLHCTIVHYFGRTGAEAVTVTPIILKHPYTNQQDSIFTFILFQ
jgi:hypothetical protein